MRTSVASASSLRNAQRSQIALMHTAHQNWKAQAVVLSAIVLIGVLYLAQPFYDDQALFVVGAQKMGQGQVLYRDYWDIKQPAVFLFYLLAGKCLGFTELGIHAFE